MDQLLQTQLPGFLVVFIIAFFIWKKYRQIVKQNVYQEIKQKLNYHEIQGTNILYAQIFFIFFLMVLVYSFFPNYYFLFIPIDFLDHPIINSFGLIVLKIALVLMVIAQINLDKETFKYAKQIEDSKSPELILYSEMLLIGALCLMFIGFIITITNVVGIISTSVAIALYIKTVKRLR